MERALVEKVHVGGAIVRVVTAGGHELVDIVEALVVAEIEDDAPVRGHDGFGALMFEAAERGALLGDGIGVHHIDLDHPAEAVRLVGLLGEIEAIVELAPLIGAFGNAHALVVGGFLVALGELAGEVAVDVFLGHDVGAPGRDAAGAIVDRSEDLVAARVCGGLKPGAAGGRARQLHLGARRDAPVQRALAHHLPLAVHLADFDHGAAMSGHLDVDARLVGVLDDENGEFLLRVLLVRLFADADDAGEHEMFVRIFVVHHEQPVLGRAVQRDEADIVVVVAELARLRFRALVARVEGRRIGKERVAPAQEHVRVVARRDMMRLVHARFDLREVEARALRLGLGLVRRHERDRPERRGDRGRRQRAAQDVAAREAMGDDLAHRAIVRGVQAFALGVFQPARGEDGMARRHLFGHDLCPSTVWKRSRSPVGS